MSRSWHGEPDYVFGQKILTLRTSIGVTQEGLATLLSISRKAISHWEAGERYPKASHLQALLALALQHGAFAAGEEEEEIRSFWRAAHQKVLLDERWLQHMFSQPATSQSKGAGELPPNAGRHRAPATESGPQVDWGEALDVPSFYGRASELAVLSRWIEEDHCRVVSVLGIGGIGKSALAIMVMHQIARHFEVVIWRSLRDNPSCAILVQTCLQVLDHQAQPAGPDALEELLRRLMEELRARRVLLVLDNLETLLEEGTGAGHLRADAPGYGQLLRHLGETRHQSCLLLTSREKLADLVPLEGKRSPVRALRLGGLDELAGAQLLEEKEVVGSPQDLERLVEVYQGNPLALKIVGQTIAELFGCEILPFLKHGEVIFGGVRDLLDEQFDRLSELEQTVFYWLAILREPVNLQNLLAVLDPAPASAQVLEALDGLLRRSLVERGQPPGSFTLQSVVLEYATRRLIIVASREIEQGQLVRLIECGLCQAQAKEYVRETQERLLVVPLLTWLQSTYLGQAGLDVRLLSLLDDLRNWDHLTQGYGPANLVALLRALQGNLCGLDLSRLALRETYLQGVQMQDTNLSGALIRDCVFTEPLDAIFAVAMSKTGAYWAAAGGRGEIRVWDGDGLRLYHAWRAHMEMSWTLTFSPDERTLASASSTGSIKLWEIGSGTLLWENRPAESFAWLAFSPNGEVLASGGVDGLVHLWDPQHGTHLKALQHTSAVFWLAWSPDGRLLAIGCFDGSIWLWWPERPEPEMRARVLVAHTHRVTGLAFSPDGTQLASVSYDGTVKLWDLITGNCLQTFTGHTDRVLRVAWSPDGRTLASCSYDATIRFWDIQTSRASRVLQGHTSVVTSLAFTPDSRTLLSGSYDGTLRVWDVESGKLQRIMGGYTYALLDLDWSPDGTRLASYGADMQVTLWDGNSGVPLSVMQEHRHMVQGQGVAWSPDGRLLASGGRDFIMLWDAFTRVRLHELRAPDAVDPALQGIAWSPDGCLLAVGSYMHGVQVWERTTRIRRWMAQTQATRIRRVAWSPDGSLLVGGGYDGSVYVWDANDGRLQQRLVGHEGIVMSVAWSPDGSLLASGGGGREGGQLFVWKMQSGERVQLFAGHSDVVSSVVWSPGGKVLISGGCDGMLRWWEVESGQCLRVREGHQGMVQALKARPDGSRLASCGDDGAIRLWDLQSGECLRTLQRDRPYERLNITSIRGLTAAQKASLRALGAFEETSRGE